MRKIIGLSFITLDGVIPAAFKLSANSLHYALGCYFR